MNNVVNNQTFWEHLDDLKKVLVRMAVAVIGVSVISFLFKDELFSIILAPGKDDFVLYAWFRKIAEILQFPSIAPEHFQIDLISTELSSQFMVHMAVAVYVAVIVCVPYLLYQLYRFISPALYRNERRYAVRVVGASYILFMVGVFLNYYLIFPLTFRFLATYQVDVNVRNIITLSSYIDTLSMMTILMGVVFEIPVLSWFLAKLGLLSVEFMQNYRRHAIVVILIVAAVITPTSDVFTLLMVSFPMWMLYELSIVLVMRTTKNS